MLWAGVPVVTFSGQTFASRVAGSLLQAVGIPEGVCSSVEAYEAQVMELATDVKLRQSVRERVERARGTSSLFDGTKIARDIEALYERMWARAVAELPPDHLLPLA
jgi:predicted O-linked N-acetylglucosamine transferase (SPINDLY family)